MSLGPVHEKWPPRILTAAATHGVALRQQLVAGRGHGFVEAQLAGRRWQAAGPRVLILHNGPLTADQRVWASVLAAPPGSMLHGLSAAAYDGLAGLTPDALCVVVPGSSRSGQRSLKGLPPGWNVQVRWSRELGPADVNVTALPPRTRLARSIVDAASERVSDKRARVIVIAAVQQRLVRTPQLWDALSRRGRCRHRAIIAESVLDAAGGIQSLPEREFALVCRQAGLPEPARQQVLRTPGGTCYLDSAWDEWGIRAEVHGIPHRNIAGWDDDLLRLNDISIHGGGLLVFSSFATRHRQHEVARQLRQMFEVRGWRPSPAD